MPWSDAPRPADDMFHRRNTDPWWNESAYFSFSLPEHKLLGMVYFWFRPNMGFCVGGPGIWDPSGEQIYNCRYWALDTCLPIPEGAEMFDFSMINGLSVKTEELQKEYSISYTGPGCDLSLTYTAVLDPYYMKMRQGELNPGIADWVAFVPEDLPVGHYEQAGRMRGTITLNGTTYQVDSASLRDHTWGPRPVVTNQHPKRGGYPWAMASPDSMFQLYATTDLEPDNDPVMGTSEQVASGWYTKDGKTAELVSGTRRCERGEDGRPIREVVDAVDDLGRTLHAEGEVDTWLAFPTFSHLLIWWCSVTWNFDGHVVPGETQDYMTFRDNRRLHESLRGAPR